MNVFSRSQTCPGGYCDPRDFAARIARGCATSARSEQPMQASCQAMQPLLATIEALVALINRRDCWQAGPSRRGGRACWCSGQCPSIEIETEALRHARPTWTPANRAGCGTMPSSPVPKPSVPKREADACVSASAASHPNSQNRDAEGQITASQGRQWRDPRTRWRQAID